MCPLFSRFLCGGKEGSIIYVLFVSEKKHKKITQRLKEYYQCRCTVGSNFIA